MIPINLYQDEYVFVLGLSRSGTSVVSALHAGGARVLGWDDSSAACELAKASSIQISDPKSVDWKKIKALVISPGIPHTLPQPHPVVALARQSQVPIVNDIELFGRVIGALPKAKRPKVIGITGTNGKSTTTSLIGHILQCENKTVHVGGNIGVPVFDLPKPTADSFYVLELSSYQLEILQSLVCNIAVMLNLSPDHLARHENMEGYIAAKSRIFQDQTAQDTCVIGLDGVVMQAIAMSPSLRGKGRFVPISTKYITSNGVSVIDGAVHANLGGRAEVLGNIDQAFALKGEHNGQNAAAAFAACSALGLRSDHIVEGMKSFTGLPHRLEFVTDHQGIRYINDSKATNPEAAAYAIQAYPDSHWIAGGVAKQGGLDVLKPYLKSLKKAYLFGECANDFAVQLNGKIKFEIYKNMESALWAAQQNADSEPAPQTVLLSPAAASFDQYANFEDRGNAFKAFIGATTAAESA